ncbi:WHG domain-containing protein [Herbiconiux moechotypicola]|uniref:TetR/AcrR family transcriptional regulator n=1 Tax=Herbiconiux moechotypicola TaxID=637393 RepID=A0ABN3D9D8_9MICO|nr:TetR/AcrR family transcriptional regulator [Herbiconiux moechotypicola]MCS5729057.1 WHG domain-containing protein [Herbiconiux moechotypicola]
MTTEAPSYHHGNLRAALLERAGATLASDGVDGLSLRQLARDLGVSHAAPGRHFRDRQALLDALALDGFEAMNSALATAAAGGGDARARLTALAEAYVGFAVENSALLALMYSVKHAPGASEALRAVGSGGLEIVAATLAAAQRAGEIAPGDPERLALVSFAAVHGVATLATNDLLDGVPVHEATRATVDLVWAGLVAGTAS